MSLKYNSFSRQIQAHSGLFDVRAMARALGGEVVGRDRILCPGPGHSRDDKSLSILLDPSAPDGFLVKSFADDDPIACRDHVRAAAGLPAWAPRSGDWAAPTRPTAAAPARTTPREDDAERKASAIARWNEARDSLGTLVERYLNEQRGLDLPDDIAGDVLRFHPSLPWKAEDGKLIRVPAMIAAMRCIHTDKLKAVHRTRLTPDGRKVDRRMLGDASETAIKLDADEDVTQGLVIGEGIETCLAARQLGLRPVWALGSAGAIAIFPILAGIEGLTILAENDVNGTNARAVEECAARWHEAEREVIIRTSKVGKDMNDAVNWLDAGASR